MIFGPENAGDTFFRNIGSHADYTEDGNIINISFTELSYEYKHKMLLTLLIVGLQ
jgi:acetoacetate decarboxylase